MWRSPFDTRTVGKISADLFLDSGDLSDLNLEGLPEKPGTHARVGITLTPPEEIPKTGRKRSLNLGSEWTQVIECDDDDEEVDQAIFPTRNWFTAGYGPFRRLSSEIADPRSTRSQLVTPIDPSSVMDRFSTLFHEDATLGEGVSWLVGLHLRSLENEKGAGRSFKTSWKYCQMDYCQMATALFEYLPLVYGSGAKQVKRFRSKK